MFTESILLFEAENLSAQIEYNNILQEAMLSEASILAEANDDKKSKMGTLKEKVKEFFKKMIKWFTERLEELKRFIANQFNKLTMYIGKARRAFMAVPKDSYRYAIKVNSKFGEVEPAFIARMGSSLSRGVKDLEVKIDFELEGLPKDSPVRKFNTSIKEAYDMFFVIEGAVKEITKAQKDIVKRCNDGIKEAKRGLVAAEKNDNQGEVRSIRELISKYQGKVTNTNSFVSKFCNALYSLLGAYARGMVAGAGRYTYNFTFNV